MFEPYNFILNLEYMGKGMLGIFIVMVLIFILIFCLNRFTGNKKED